MEIKKEEIPSGYIYCMATNGQCKRAKTCLRALAMRFERDENDWSLMQMVDPRYVKSRTEKEPCQWYADAKIQRFAKGMTHLYDEIPAKVLKTMREKVQHCFPSRTFYFKARRGDKLISEEQQAYIAEVFKDFCPEIQPKCDEYIDALEWNP